MDPSPSPYEESVLGALRRISQALDQHSRQLARTHSLTAPQLVCLRVIGRGEGPNAAALARAVSLSQPTVAGILKRLIERGLVERQRCERDRRTLTLALTGEGRALLERAPSPLHERFAANLAAMHPGEQALIDWVLGRVAGLMDGDGEAPDGPAVFG